MSAPMLHPLAFGVAGLLESASLYFRRDEIRAGLRSLGAKVAGWQVHHLVQPTRETDLALFREGQTVRPPRHHRLELWVARSADRLVIVLPDTTTPWEGRRGPSESDGVRLGDVPGLWHPAHDRQARFAFEALGDGWAGEAPLVIAGHGRGGAAAESLAARLVAGGSGEGLEAVITFGASPGASPRAAGWLGAQLGGRGVAYWNGLEALPPLPGGWRRSLPLVRLVGPFTGLGWLPIATRADWRHLWRRQSMGAYHRALVAAGRWSGRQEMVYKLRAARS